MAAPASEQIIRQMFATFTDFSTSLDQLKAFLTSDYQQIVDGRTLTLDDFLTHARALREALQSLEITVERIICQEDMAATVHVARATRLSGHISTIKVIAFFQLREGRIALVDELTHVLEGNSEDKTLGSLQ
ncbi:nuclear transport factor 2 family protein [Acetobacter malorum]|uniref:nuclear transport factor 2 family protein n=1 Tax=Acetobacter malorum TaxID=178901 RepID=UPI0039EB5721